MLNNNESEYYCINLCARLYNPRNILIIKLSLLFDCQICKSLKAKMTDFNFIRGIRNLPLKKHKTDRKTKKANYLPNYFSDKGINKSS